MELPFYTRVWFKKNNNDQFLISVIEPSSVTPINAKYIKRLKRDA